MRVILVFHCHCRFYCSFHFQINIKIKSLIYLKLNRCNMVMQHCIHCYIFEISRNILFFPLRHATAMKHTEECRNHPISMLHPICKMQTGVFSKWLKWHDLLFTSHKSYLKHNKEADFVLCYSNRFDNCGIVAVSLLDYLHKLQFCCAG